MTNYSASGRDYLKPHLLIHCCLVALVFASAQMCQDPIIIRPSSADLIHCCIVAKVLASAPAVPRPYNHTAISWPNTLLHIVAKVFTSAQLCRDPLIIRPSADLIHCCIVAKVFTSAQLVRDPIIIGPSADLIQYEEIHPHCINSWNSLWYELSQPFPSIYPIWEIMFEKSAPAWWNVMKWDETLEM